MQSIKLRTLLTYILVPLFIVLAGCLLLQNKYIKENQRIMVQTQPGSGTVTFRGAMIDGNWYEPQNVVSSSDGWVLQEEKNVLTDTAGNPLVLNLPMGVERLVVFDVGPDQGVANVSVGGKAIELCLGDIGHTDYGWAFQLPYVRFSNKAKLSVIALCMLALLAVIMLAVNAYLKRRTPQIRKEVKDGKNSAIEFLRFFMSISVMLHHFTSYAPSGYLTVDFFFLLSGFFLMNHFTKNVAERENCLNSEATDPVVAAAKYVKERYVRLIPYYLPAFFLSLGLAVCLVEGRTFEAITDSFWELFMLEGFGFSNDLFIGAGWYCSSLLIASCLIYFLLGKCQKTYLYILAPANLFLVFSWMAHNIGHLNRWTQFDTFISTGTLRGFAEIGLGCIAYQIYVVLRSRNWGARASSTILELICFSYIVYIIFIAGPSPKDFVCVFAMMALIVSLSLKKSLWFQLLNNRLSRALGWSSIGIYLNHPVIMQRIPWNKMCAHFGLPWSATLMMYLFVVITFSAISTRFVELALNYFGSKEREKR